MSGLEKFALNRADKINLVSPAFQHYFVRRYPNKQFSYITNGIDAVFAEAGPQNNRASVSTKRVFSIVYAGNVGEGQGLHRILPSLAKHTAERMEFHIIGDGGRKAELQSALSEARVENVKISPPMPRSVLLKEYLEADVLFLHLNDWAVFEHVLPSKIFEYAALGKPIWAGVAGFAAKFIRDEVSNAALFAPCDVPGALAAFDSLTLRDMPRSDFVKKYSRESTSHQLASDILSLAT